MKYHREKNPNIMCASNKVTFNCVAQCQFINAYQYMAHTHTHTHSSYIVFEKSI